MSIGTPSAATRPHRLGRVVDRLSARRAELPPETGDYSVVRGVRVPMRDGSSLAADLYLPDSPALGTVLVRGPYGRSFMFALPFARLFAARGFAVLFVSSRGTFGSEGAFDPMITEADDGHDIVAWMREQPWYGGRFATLGPSYLGFTQWALLTDPPEDLVAAVLFAAPHDFSRHVWGTGAFRLDFLGWSRMVVDQGRGGTLNAMVRMAGAERRDAKAMDLLPLAESGQDYLDGRGPWYRDWISRPDLSDPFWEPMQLRTAVERAEIPILLLAGWQDLFLSQMLEQYDCLHGRGVDVALTVGPWSHRTLGIGRAEETMREAYDWLNLHLARHGQPADRRAPVRYFVAGADEWRDAPSWPPPSTPRAAYLCPDGRLGWEPPAGGSPSSSFVYDPADPTPTVGGPMLTPKCQVDDTALAERPDVLSWTSPPLEAAVEVVGAPVLELAHASDHPHADVFARLSEVDTAGRSRNITEGYLRLDPDRGPGPVSVELRATAHRFVAGTRVRVLVAGGSHPQFARNLGTGEDPATGTRMRPCRQTVTYGGDGISALRLPVADHA